MAVGKILYAHYKLWKENVNYTLANRIIALGSFSYGIIDNNPFLVLLGLFAVPTLHGASEMYVERKLSLSL